MDQINSSSMRGDENMSSNQVKLDM